MGYRQHLVRSRCWPSASKGGVPSADGSRIWPEPRPRRAQRRPSSRRRGSRARPDRVDDRPRRGAERRRRPDLPSTAQLTPAREQLDPRGHRGGLKHVYTEKPTGRGGWTVAVELARPARDAGHQARRRAGQAVPAGAACKLKRLHRRGILRPDPVGPRRVRLLGVRGRLAAAPSGRRGTTAPRRVAASCSTCSAHRHYVLEQPVRAGSRP